MKFLRFHLHSAFHQMITRHLLGSSRILARCVAPLASQIPVWVVSEVSLTRRVAFAISQMECPRVRKHPKYSAFSIQQRNMLCFAIWYCLLNVSHGEVKEFVANEVEPQAMEYNEKEMFNMELFK